MEHSVFVTPISCHKGWLSSLCPGDPIDTFSWHPHIVSRIQNMQYYTFVWLSPVEMIYGFPNCCVTTAMYNGYKCHLHVFLNFISIMMACPIAFYLEQDDRWLPQFLRFSLCTSWVWGCVYWWEISGFKDGSDNFLASDWFDIYLV